MFFEPCLSSIINQLSCLEIVYWKVYLAIVIEKRPFTFYNFSTKQIAAENRCYE
jgi:hypothetical protein